MESESTLIDPTVENTVRREREEFKETMPLVIGGRYGLASKEFNAGMVKAIFAELKKSDPIKHFTIGIEDDVTHLSLDYEKEFSLEQQYYFRGLFFGLGADGTLRA